MNEKILHSLCVGIVHPVTVEIFVSLYFTSVDDLYGVTDLELVPRRTASTKGLIAFLM